MYVVGVTHYLFSQLVAKKLGVFGLSSSALRHQRLSAINWGKYSKK